MSGFVALCLGLLLFSQSARAGWQEELSPAQPGPFPGLRLFHAKVKFGWTAFTAGEATADYTRIKPGVTRLAVKGGTTGFVRTLWRLDATAAATMQAATLHPINLRQTEAYKEKKIITKLDFSPESVTTLRETDPPDPTPPKPKHFDFPNVFELNSAYQWLRSQKLANGDVYHFVVCPEGTPYLAEVDVIGRAKLNVAEKSWSAVKMELKLSHIKDDMTLESHGKFKHATAWISDDPNRVLLRIEAEIFVGSVWMELDSFEAK